MLNKIIDKLTFFIPTKTVVKIERRPLLTHPAVRAFFADKAKQAFIASPITDEDEAFNDGVDAAIKRIWDI